MVKCNDFERIEKERKVKIEDEEEAEFVEECFIENTFFETYLSMISN
jgi:hypothetical protein